MKNLTIVLPSLNPDEKLERVAGKLAAAGFRDIVIINDGSDEAHQAPFERAAREYGCLVLNHEVNKGKGRALKTGFAFVLANRPDTGGVITVDGDDQHQVEDILACGQALTAPGSGLILGVRDFSGRDVPWRSRLGNIITSFVFWAFCGLRVSDTQTGLRGIPPAWLQAFCQVPGERFEYETNMLLVARRRRIPIREVRISTVYWKKNASSHFRVIQDSLKIYGAIFRFLLSSLAASAVDLGTFTVLNLLLDGRLFLGRRLLIATAAARIVSGLFNYGCNHKIVFQSGEPVGKTFVRYGVLALSQAAVSYAAVYGLAALLPGGPLAELCFKIVVDLLLFLLSFQIQRRWVFGGAAAGASPE
ncbi:MAG: bifunctional glycosyltransferase family 2/GtrA family protein [Peptococcaceae bacterium]|jgi:glycosyltransferase involved in cell wall biosynthesis|nr:bifunctional glycosyltransferase family 2/GtrA family protein [Peptococcaceae bacterium]